MDCSELYGTDDGQSAPEMAAREVSKMSSATLPSPIGQEEEQNVPCFGTLYGESPLSPGVPVANPAATTQSIFRVVTRVIVLVIAEVAAAVIYRPSNIRTSTFFDEQGHQQEHIIDRVARLRYAVEKYGELEAGWDGEDAEPVSEATRTTAGNVLMKIAQALLRSNAASFPHVRPSPDGSVSFNWVQGNRELAMFVNEDNVEVQRWEPLDSYASQGFWELTSDTISEHIDWLLGLL